MQLPCEANCTGNCMVSVKVVALTSVAYDLVRHKSTKNQMLQPITQWNRMIPKRNSGCFHPKLLG